MAGIFNPKTNTYIIDAVWHATNSPLSGRNDIIRVKSVRWVGAADGDELVITNYNDTVEIWRSIATAADFSDSFLVEDDWMDGFKVITLGSGRVYIDLR